MIRIQYEGKATLISDTIVSYNVIVYVCTFLIDVRMYISSYHNNFCVLLFNRFSSLIVSFAFLDNIFTKVKNCCQTSYKNYVLDEHTDILLSKLYLTITEIIMNKTILT